MFKIIGDRVLEIQRKNSEKNENQEIGKKKIGRLGNLLSEKYTFSNGMHTYNLLSKNK